MVTAAEMSFRNTRVVAPPPGPARRSPPLPSAVRLHLAEERKRAFLRMVSHELRTPLNAIIGFSEIISRELYGPLQDTRYRDQAEIIRVSGLKLLGLVNQVMEIARLEMGAADLDIRPEQPELALDEAMSMVRAEAEAKGVEMTIKIEEGRYAQVLADPRGLKTVYTHLLQNAVTASPEGGRVTARLYRSGKSVITDIIDEGPGAGRSEIARFMRPFEQGENPLTRSGEGAGLGLPIASLLCQAMDGRLRLSSEPGQGMRARVLLRAAPAQSATQGPAQGPAASLELKPRGA